VDRRAEDPVMRDSTIEAIIGAIHEVGYVVIPSVLSASQASTLCSIIAQLREREPREDARELGHHRVLHIAAKHRAFVDLMCHPVVMQIWQRVLGPDFICSTWSSNTVLPRAGATYWHVDHPYWTIAPPYPVEPALTGQTIWCLDDFTADNGATRFIPGSHRRDHMPEHAGDYDDEGVTVEAPRGSLILSHGATWHSMGINQTDAPRTAIFGRYARSYIVPQEDMKLQLPAIEAPSRLVARLLGAEQYIPQKGFPY
jgi:ectoine hydroxylase-related dioxygenase (phytanoyl-CoA dioxygenase family)